jgi:hypothetical protein
MAPSTGEFYTFTLADTTPTPVTTPTKQATDHFVNQYLNTSIEFKMDDFSVDLLKTETTPPPGGKNIAMAKQIYQQQQTQQKPSSKRKRTESPRQVGRPSMHNRHRPLLKLIKKMILLSYNFIVWN